MLRKWDFTCPSSTYCFKHEHTHLEKMHFHIELQKLKKFPQSFEKLFLVIKNCCIICSDEGCVKNLVLIIFNLKLKKMLSLFS